MLVPLSWLEEFVKTNTTAAKIAEKLLLSGTKVEEITKKSGETVFNLEITPNRPDTLSIYGVAREVAALFEKELWEIQTDLIRDLPEKDGKVALKLEDKKLCPYYSAVKVGGIVVKDSPDWMKKLLTASGIRPINNVVDITNFVMLETGQPMHAFDTSKIKGTLTIRSARKGEKVKTLDSVERTLNEEAIIIEDSEKLIDLAGLMGGENSEVDKDTTEILLHVPVYEPVIIRKTSLFTNLRTEASNRFEKKLDPNMHPKALRRALKLLIEYAHASSSGPVTTVGYPVNERVIEFDFNLVKEILGLELSKADVINLLTPLGFLVKTSPLKEESLSIEIHSHRLDIAISEDILEEIGRMYGYNNFPKTLPAGFVPTQKELFQPDNYDLLRSQVLRNGFTELTGYTLIPEKDLVCFEVDKDKAVKVLHPTSSDFEFLRPYLLINLVKAISTNQNKSELSAFFEIGKEFKADIDPKTKLPKQNVSLALVTTASYRHLKGVLEALVGQFSLKLDQEIVQPDNKILYFGVKYFEGKHLVAKVGNVRKNLLDKYDIKVPVYSAWIDFEYVQNLSTKAIYKPEPKYPSVIEDVSFFVEQDTQVGTIISAMEKIDKLITNVEFLDAFTKDSKQSVTLRINYQDPSKTLTDNDVKSARSKVQKLLTSRFKVKIREV